MSNNPHISNTDLLFQELYEADIIIPWLWECECLDIHPMTVKECEECGAVSEDPPGYPQAVDAYSSGFITKEQALELLSEAD